MEAVTAGAKAAGTGSKTIADLLPLAVERYGDASAQRFKVGDEWKDVSYAELGEAVREVALGLVDLGIEPGEKISILAHTRPEWTHACFGILTAGATLVTIYQTNSPEECQYVLHHSDSRAVFVEDGEQLAKIRAIEDECPELEHVIVIEPGDADLGDARAAAPPRARGRGGGGGAAAPALAALLAGQMAREAGEADPAEVDGAVTVTVLDVVRSTTR
jgi:long-chain acyl-CoA synthetase